MKGEKKMNRDLIAILEYIDDHNILINQFLIDLEFKLRKIEEKLLCEKGGKGDKIKGE